MCHLAPQSEYLALKTPGTDKQLAPQTRSLVAPSGVGVSHRAVLGQIFLDILGQNFLAFVPRFGAEPSLLLLWGRTILVSGQNRRPCEGRHDTWGVSTYPQPILILSAGISCQETLLSGDLSPLSFEKQGNQGNVAMTPRSMSPQNEAWMRPRFGPNIRGVITRGILVRAPRKFPGWPRDREEISTVPSRKRPGCPNPGCAGGARRGLAPCPPGATRQRRCVPPSSFVSPVAPSGDEAWRGC